MSPQNNVGRAGAGMGAAEMALRGFDDYEVTLGDEMRGERAALGVSLADVERELRIKASTILAIENADVNGFPNPSVVPGYVRSYARYLGLDAEQTYKRFCDESGYRSPSAPVAMAAPGRSGNRRVAINSRVGANLTESRFAPPPAPSRIGSSVSLGAVASAIAMVALVGGLGYGGFQLLQDIQKVGMSPLPAADEIVAETPVIELPPIETASADRPDASAYEDDGVLATFASAELPPPQLALRDGPIADIDPRAAGVFARATPIGTTEARTGAEDLKDLKLSAEARGSEFAPGGWNDGIVIASLSSKQMMADVVDDAALLTMSAGAATAERSPQAQATAIHATGEAWIRVKDGKGTVLFEGILNAGQTFQLPKGVKNAELRAGNAGDVYVRIGSKAYGPVGKPGRVVSGIALDEDAVSSQLATARGIAPSGDETVRSAEAALPTR